MKKSFHISLISLLILLFTICTGSADGTKNDYGTDSFKNQIGLQASDGSREHDMIFLVSPDENDFDADKTFLDFPFSLFIKHILFLRSDSGSNTAIDSVSEFVHYYHLPKYLLFHNLKIRFSAFILLF